MLEITRTINTIDPPKRVAIPGFSPIINQINIGAKTASIKSIKPTSADVIYLGPVANNEVPREIIIIKIKIRYKSEIEIMNGFTKNKRIKPINKEEMPAAGTIEKFAALLAAVKLIPKQIATPKAHRSPNKDVCGFKDELNAIIAIPIRAPKIVKRILVSNFSFKNTLLKIALNIGEVLIINNALATDVNSIAVINNKLPTP